MTDHKTPDGAPPTLFDRTAERRFAARAERAGRPDFLHAYVGEALADRLSIVNRQFTRIVDIGGHALPYLQSPAGGKTTTVDAFWDVTGDALPLGEGSADLIVSNLVLHSVNDLPGLLVQIRRALVADGLVLATLLGGDSLSELRAAFLTAESEITGGVHPRVAPMADVRDVGNLLGRAGLALPVADSETLTVTYDSMLNLINDLRALGWQNALTGRSRRFLRRDVLMRAAEIYGERFTNADGRVTATFEFMTLTGWHPHDSQQKPMKPGSAKSSLAQALQPGDTSLDKDRTP